jgi:hypothetical protein
MSWTSLLFAILCFQVLLKFHLKTEGHMLTLKFIRLNYLIVNIISSINQTLDCGLIIWASRWSDFLTAETWQHWLWRTESRCCTQIIRALIKSLIPIVWLFTWGKAKNESKKGASEGHVSLKHEEINKGSFVWKYSTWTVKKEKW